MSFQQLRSKFRPIAIGGTITPETITADKWIFNVVFPRFSNRRAALYQPGLFFDPNPVSTVLETVTVDKWMFIIQMPIVSLTEVVSY